MIIKLTKSDNDIIVNHFYKYNRTVEVHQKMAIDFYIESIEFLDDIKFHGVRIKPVLDDSCDITKDNVGDGRGQLGETFDVFFSQFEKPYSDILSAAIREIKLNRII